MKKLELFLQKFDNLFPNPWIVDGTVQTRPVFQLGMWVGVIVTLLVIFLIL